MAQITRWGISREELHKALGDGLCNVDIIQERKLSISMAFKHRIGIINIMLEEYEMMELERFFLARKRRRDLFKKLEERRASKDKATLVPEQSSEEV